MVHVLSLVSYQFLPPRFGGSKGIALFYQFFSARVALTCVTTRQNDPADAAGYEVLNRLSTSPLRYINPFYFFTLRKLIRQKKITHLLLEHPYYGWLAVLLKWFTGVKLVVHSHNIEGLRWKSLGKWWWKILWLYEKWTHRQADFNYFKQSLDLQYALTNYGLNPQRCTVITYGIGWDTAPTPSERNDARSRLLELHAIPATHELLLFNGAFDYPPNLRALEALIDQVNPLMQQTGTPYTILICGKNIPGSISKRIIPNMIIVGFVDDINLYFKGCGTFLNPVIEGGGIKTKLVEALGNGMNAVSVHSGAAGVDPALCGNKLLVTPDHDWPAFAQAALKLAGNKSPMPDTFFQHFYWGNIAKKAATYIQT